MKIKFPVVITRKSPFSTKERFVFTATRVTRQRWCRVCKIWTCSIPVVVTRARLARLLRNPVGVDLSMGNYTGYRNANGSIQIGCQHYRARTKLVAFARKWASAK